MFRIKLEALPLVVLSLCVVPSAMAGDPPTPRTTPVQPGIGPLPAAPRFQCSITPPSAAGPHQITSITVKKEGGTLTNDVHVLVRLGTQTSGRPIARVCTSKFVNNQVTLNPVAIRPPVTDPNYIWLCNAVASGKCHPDQPPPGSKPPAKPN